MRIADLAATVTSPLDGRDRRVEAAAPVSDERRRSSLIEEHTRALIRAHAERHGESPADDLALAGWLAAWDGAIAEAEESLLAALAVDPGHGPARYALGQVRWWQDRHDEAVACLAPVAADRWAGWSAHWMLGAVHQDMGDDAAAERHLRRALAAEPDKDNPAAAMSLASIALRRGDLRRGWGLHEARKRHPMWAPTIRSRVAPRLPRWTGRASLRGKTLALPAEDGLGDKILHARFLGPLAARARAEGGAVLVETSAPLVPLLAASIPGDAEIVEYGCVPERAPDTWIEPESLPHVFGTTVEDIPPCPYLRAAPADVEHWRARLPLDRGRLNVGLVWAGGHPRAERPADDRAGKSYLRNVPLAALEPLARVPGVRWFALQKGDNEDDPAPPGMDLLRLGPSLRDFGDTAAVASLLDVIVTVDTSVANLIGGLGLPGLVLLPKAADWRWMTGPTTPWFPTLELFRQEHHGDWSAPVARVADALRRLAASRAVEPANLGALPLVGLRGIDEHGAFVSWLPERAAISTTA